MKNNNYEFDYYYGAESDQFSFIRIPKLLLSDPKFLNLSYGAILTYGFLLDRMGLSMKNGWHDENNRVYIRYKVSDLTDVLGKTEDTISSYLKELENIGLIERVRSGLGKGKITYVKNFITHNLRDGNLITLKNSGNGESLNQQKDCEFEDLAEKISTNEATEASKINITLKTSGNVSLESSGIITGENKGNITLNKSGHSKTETNNTYINYTNHFKSDLRLDYDDEFVAYKEIIRENIDYEILISGRFAYDVDEVNGLVDLMAEIMISKGEYTWIASNEYPTNLVKGKFMKIKSKHIEYVLDCLHKNTSKIYNIKKYLLASLFNAPSTIDSYYMAEVLHDQYGS